MTDGALTTGTISAGSAVLHSGAQLTLGALAVRGNLDARGVSGIGQTAAANIGGNASFATASGNVVLDQAGNRMAGAVALAGRDLTVVAASGLQLAAADAAGKLSLSTTGGPITQTPGSTVKVAGATALAAAANGGAAAIMLGNEGNDFVGVIEARGAAIKLYDASGSLKLGNVDATGLLEATAKGGILTLEPGTLQLARGGMILIPDPRPSAFDFPKVRAESLSNVRIAVSAPAFGNAAPTRVTLLATDLGGSGDGSMIKVSGVPLSSSSASLIPIGKVITLDTAGGKAAIIRSASFEVVDGLAGGASLELDGDAGMDASVDNATGKVTLSGERSAAEYDKMLQGIQLRMGSGLPTGAVLTIRVSLTDAAGNTESRTVTLRMNEPQQVTRRPPGRDGTSTR